MFNLQMSFLKLCFTIIADYTTRFTVLRFRFNCLLHNPPLVILYENVRNRQIFPSLCKSQIASWLALYGRYDHYFIDHEKVFYNNLPNTSIPNCLQS